MFIIRSKHDLSPTAIILTLALRFEGVVVCGISRNERAGMAQSPRLRPRSTLLADNYQHILQRN